MKIAICNSDVKEADELIKNIKGSEILPSAECDLLESGNRLLSEISEYNVVFLDTNVSAPIELGKDIKRIHPKALLIFTSNSASHAVDAFDCRAFHYIIKGDLHKLYKVLTLIRDELEVTRSYVIHSRGELISTDISAIYYVEYREKYCVFHTIKGVYRERGSISKLEKVLATSGFISVHQSFLVNAAYIRKIGKNTVTLTNGAEIMMSVRKKKFVLEEYRKLLGNG